jgi:hypothetical protein
VAQGILISPELKMIFNSLVSSVPAFRMTLNELCSHPWIKNFPVDEAKAKEEMHLVWL